MQIIWDFIQNQVLGMQWLNNLIGKILTILGIDISTRIGISTQFFIYDMIKILTLLCVLIYIISYIGTYFPPERTKKIIAKYKGVWANIVGALIGTVTPFCSCSSIPLFMGFTNAGLPLGVTFSFLISSPLVDLGAFILLISVFGGKVAAAYVIVGLMLAVRGGTLINKLGLEKYVEKHIETLNNTDGEVTNITKKDRFIYSKEQVISTVKKVFWYVVIGVAIGALIHNWIPEEFIQKILGANNPFSVLIATFIGTPMYADIFGTIPIAQALFEKGVGIGTILAFMMSVTALSVPSIIMLRKAVKPKLLAIFVLIVVIGIIMIGYAFNAFAFLII